MAGADAYRSAVPPSTLQQLRADEAHDPRAVDRRVTTLLGRRAAPPARHWRSSGDQKLPTGAEALGEPFAAFPSWLLRIECDRCGKVQIINEVHAPWRDRTLRTILRRMRHDGCGGRVGSAQLITDSEAVSSRPLRKIVLRK